MTRAPKRHSGGIGGLVVLMVGCGACCAGPLLAALGAVTTASLATTLFVPAAAVLTVAGGIGVAVLIRRRRNRRACAFPARGADLPAPVPRQISAHIDPERIVARSVDESSR